MPKRARFKVWYIKHGDAYWDVASKKFGWPGRARATGFERRADAEAEALVAASLHPDKIGKIEVYYELVMAEDVPFAFRKKKERGSGGPSPDGP